MNLTNRMISKKWNVFELNELNELNEMKVRWLCE